MSSSRQQHKVPAKSLSIGSSVISRSDSARNLGVIMDSTLSMESHISSVCQSTYLQLRNIGKIRKYLTDEATKKVIHACISSRLDYNNALLYGLPKSQLHRLQRIQNSAARIVQRCKKSDHMTPHLKHLHWLPVQQRIKFKILTLTYKCLHGLAPQYLSDLLSVYNPSRTLRSSSSMQLVVPKTKLSSYGDRSFAKVAPFLWNNIPVNVKMATSVDEFKGLLKTHLFQEYFKM